MPTMVSLPQRGKLMFCLAQQFFFVMPVVAPKNEDRDRCYDKHQQAKRPRDAMEGLPQQIPAGPE